MPEYGFADKDPERIAEEQAEARFLKDSTAAFKRAELQEIEDRRRQANAEQEKLANQEKMIEELRKIANAAEKRAELAEQKANYAREDAHEAKRRSQIANTISISAIIVALLTWLTPREAVYSAICAFFQSL